MRRKGDDESRWISKLPRLPGRMKGTSNGALLVRFHFRLGSSMLYEAPRTLTPHFSAMTTAVMHTKAGADQAGLIKTGRSFRRSDEHDVSKGLSNRLQVGLKANEKMQTSDHDDNIIISRMQTRVIYVGIVARKGISVASHGNRGSPC